MYELILSFKFILLNSQGWKGITMLLIFADEEAGSGRLKNLPRADRLKVTEFGQPNSKCVRWGHVGELELAAQAERTLPQTTALHNFSPANLEII